MANDSSRMDTGYPRGHLADYVRLTVLASAVALQGCAYTVASTASLAVTGRSISDHALSTMMGDCRTGRYVTGGQDYWCEQPRTPDSVYNRNAY
jgi:hypothetical protein